MKRYIILILIVLLGVGADMLSKQFLMEKSVIIEGILSFYPTMNTGGGWSIFSDATLFLTIFSAVAVIGIIVLNFFFKPKSWVWIISMGLILAGAIGNLIDRIAFGAVRDFIKFDFINFPIFNVADMCLCFGAILLAVYLIFIHKTEEKTKNEA